MKIADRQHKSLPEALETNPGSHLWLWAAYFEREYTEHQVTHYYLAQIAAEIRRTRAKNPRQVELKHFMLKFAPRGKGGSSGVDIKTAWMAMLGMKADGTPLPGAKRLKATPRNRPRGNQPPPRPVGPPKPPPRQPRRR